MYEIHVKVCHCLSFIEAVVLSRVGKCAKHCGFNIHAAGQCKKLLKPVLRHCHSHALLGLGYQYLPGLKTRVLERRAIKVQLKPPGFLSHLTNRRGEAAGPVISN